MTWVTQKIAERLGGASFNTQPIYKFERIKQRKRNFIQKHPDVQLLDFGIGEPDGLPPACAIETLQNVCALPDYQGYADNGADFFKEAALRYLSTIFNINNLTSDQCLPIIGIKSGLELLAGTLINPGDMAACPIPGYGVFATQVQYFQGKIYPVSLKLENHFLPDLQAIPEKIKQQIKVFYLNYPHNPTGAVATREFFETLIQQTQTYHWIIIHDAAYSALAFGEPLSLLQIPGATECCIELHSMSKGFNMTGWRCGWMCGNTTLIQACALYKNNCDSGQYLAIQKAAAVALDHASQWLPALRKHYQERLVLLADLLKNYGFQTLPSRAGFFLYVVCPKNVFCKSTKLSYSFSTAADCAAWLLEHCGIVVVPWDDCGPYLRFSVTFKTKNINSFFQDLQQHLSDYIFINE